MPDPEVGSTWIVIGSFRIASPCLQAGAVFLYVKYKMYKPGNGTACFIKSYPFRQWFLQ